MTECDNNFNSIIELVSNYLGNTDIALLSRTCKQYCSSLRRLQYGYFEGARYPDSILQLVKRMNSSSLQYINISKSRTSRLILDYAIAMDPISTMIVHNDDTFESQYMHCDWDTFRQNKEITAAYDRIILYYVGNNNTPSNARAIKYILNKQVWIFNYSNKCKSKLLPLYKPYMKFMNYINATKYELKSKVKMILVDIDSRIGIADIPGIMFALAYPHLCTHYVDLQTYEYRLDQVLFLAAVKYIGDASVVLHHNASGVCNNTMCNMCSLLLNTVKSDYSSNHIVIATSYRSAVVDSLIESINRKYVTLSVLYSRTIQGIIYEQRVLQGAI